MKLAVYLSLFVACASSALADQSLGVTSIEAIRDDQTRPLILSVWYPGRGGEQEDVGANAVFKGVVAGRDAALAVDQLPIVFLSHGGLRSAADSGAWLAAALARAGYLAVEINALRPTTATDAVDEIWRRPDDVSQALDTILDDPVWSKHIDQDRISVVGFALGGTAALAFGGGEFDMPSFVQSCDEISQGPDCAWYQAQDVALASVYQNELAIPRRDARIGAVVAIAPEYLNVVSGVDVATLLVSLGRDTEPPSDVPANILNHAVLPEATLFDGFQVCTVAGREILADDGGDPALCGPSAEARQRTHNSIVSDVVTFLQESGG